MAESTAGRAKFGPLEAAQIEEWLAGKRPRPLLAIPFGGPIPDKASPLGTDLDGEYFDRRSDVYPTLFSERPIIWHHGNDPTGRMGGTVLGKATDLRLGIDGEGEPEAEGWWVDAWILAGDNRRAEIAARQAVANFKGIVRRGATIYGSSAPLKSRAPFFARKPDGHIEKWAYAEQTLSTSPQNTMSTFGPMKAHLALFDGAGIDLPLAIRGVLSDLDNLGADLTATSNAGSGDDLEKAGRVLASSVEDDIRAALDALSRVIDRHMVAMKRHATEDAATQPE